MDELILASPAELKAQVATQLNEAQRILDDIVGARGARKPDNTLVPYNWLVITIGRVWNAVALLRSVHPDGALRACAEECEKTVASFVSKLGLNRELFDAVNRCDTSTLDAEGQRLVKQILRDFRRAGVDKDEPTRERVRVLREELVALVQEFKRNIVEDVRSIELDGESELKGLPRDYQRAHPPGQGGKIRITTDYPDYTPFLTYASSGPRREELYKEFRRRAHPANIEVLRSLLGLRHELASLLGYPSWAAYATEDKMIKSPAAVQEFIERVSELATARARREYDVLLSKKQEEDPKATEVRDWEKVFLEHQVKSERYKVDAKEIRAYFEYSRVKEGLLSLVEELFGIQFKPAPAARPWHEDVEAFDVIENGAIVGRVYLDMHPREGKFKHAAMFPLVRGVKDRTIPHAALVCNFPNPRKLQGSALLEHDEVLTFFHEFGHLLHQLFARDHEWAKFSGASTEWDFIEVPSQLFEEWAWDFEVLRRFAIHHETGEPIPASLVARMVKARDFGRGLWARHQMFYASVSLGCYGPDAPRLDTSALVQSLQRRYSLFRFVDETYFQASFGHLDDYSALYYTYMWSLVIEKDIHESWKRKGAMNREAAARYRDCILRPGSSADAADLVRDFLGRDYSFDAFESWLNGTEG